MGLLHAVKVATQVAVSVLQEIALQNSICINVAKNEALARSAGGLSWGCSIDNIFTWVDDESLAKRSQERFAKKLEKKGYCRRLARPGPGGVFWGWRRSELEIGRG